MSLSTSLDSAQSIASLIDHTLLKPEATRQEIAQLCLEAREFGFASVCVNPFWVPFAIEKLSGAGVRVSTVIGFPLGANQTATKIAEARLALSQGATELDMVQNIGALRSREFDTVRDEIGALAHLAHSEGAILKVILETVLLDEEEKIMASKLALEAQADFVKTSTGFAKTGATVEDVQLMRRTVGPAMGVKAAGGVRTLEALRQMVEAGATRIGTSSGTAILRSLHTPQSEAPAVMHAAKVPGGRPDSY